MKKGSGVLVEGRLQSRSWDGPDGQKRSTIEVIANNVQFLRGQAGAGKDREAPVDVSQASGKEEIAEIQLDEPSVEIGGAGKEEETEIRSPPRPRRAP